MVDIHSHIAWAIDDGMPSKEDAIQTFKMAKKDGIDTICSTPHFVCGQLSSSILNAIKSRQNEAIVLGKEYGVTVLTGSEMFMNSDFVSCLKNGLFQTLNETRYLLCEFDVRRDIRKIDDFDEYLYEITLCGMIPVIAHVERYFHEGLDFEILDTWQNNGYVMQVNRTSLQGLHGKTVKKNAWELLKRGYAHVIASDCHRCDGARIEKLSDIYLEIEKKYGKEYADTICVINPNRIINDQTVIEMQPKKKGFFWRR